MKYLVIVLIMSIALLGCSEKTTVANASSITGIAATSTDERKAQISELLNLDDETRFWEIYAEYEKDINKVLKEHTALYAKFHAQYNNGSLDEQHSINMMAEYFRVEAKIMQAKQNHMSIFQQVLPVKDVFRLYQLDHQ